MRVAIPKNIEIRTDIRCEGETVLATPGDLGQVVVNLCSNASHAMGESGGLLEVDLESAYLDNPAALGHERLGPGNYVKLVVRDNGAGIDPEIMDRIFKPYFTTKEIDQGLGMGLSVVYGIVKDYDGSTKVESRPGEGTSMANIPDLPMVLCTGHSDRIAEERSRACGFKAFVMKPLVKRVLARTVRKVMDETKVGADR